MERYRIIEVYPNGEQNSHFYIEHLDIAQNSVLLNDRVSMAHKYLDRHALDEKFMHDITEWLIFNDWSYSVVEFTREIISQNQQKSQN